MSTRSDPVTAAPPRPGALRRAWLGLRLRDAVLVTVVPLGMVALLFAGAVADYWRTRQFDDWWARDATVAGLFSARVQAIAAMPPRLLLRQGLDQDAPDAGIIRLDVPGRAWDSMHGDPQRMWGEWVEGTLRHGGTAIPVRLRKRGDNSIHWLTDKRTMTVRTPRDEFYKDFRGFGLSIKDVLPAWTVNRLAAEFGLPGPATEVVPVFLNNRFYGMFRFVELADESFLRRTDRMPGNIFRGDRAERGDYMKGVPRALFENPVLWERTALNERWTSAGAGQLELLLADIQSGTLEGHLRMMARSDRAELARLLAYLLFAGDPYHMSGVHNQLIYEDPSTQLLHPIPWDVRLLDLASPGGQAVNPWFRALLRDPFLVDAMAREVRARLADGSALRAADSLVRAAEERYGRHFAYDRLRAGLVPDVGRPDEVMAQLRRNAALLARWMDSAVVAVGVDAPPGGPAVLDLELRGFAGVTLDSVAVEGAVAGAVTLRPDRNADGAPDAGDVAVPVAVRPGAGVTWLVPAQPVPLHATWDGTGPGLHPGRMPYRLFVTGVPAGRRLEPAFTAAGGGPVTVLPWAPGAAIAAGTGWHPWTFPVRQPRRHVLAGTVRLPATLRIPEGDTLDIAPGAELRLDPDVSVIVRGLLRARGTALRPIRVVPSDPVLPWGTFSLQGHGADGSVVEHTEFVRGGGALVDRIEYIGMVNIHRADRVTFSHVVFRGNIRSDDTFHALHARDVVLRNSRFVDANSDAVDFDVADGLIADNVFEGSGGDAIDLMASDPLVVGNRVAAAGDKGISVGEASHPVIFNNLVERSLRGIEVKDRSMPLVLHSEFRGNHTGLRAQMKNWRYGDGGWGTFVLTRFDDNATRWESDTLSRLTRLGVTGLDSAAVDDPPADVRWLYERLGLRPVGPAGPGLVERWERVPPVPPLAAGRFHDDFGPVSDGWRAGGGTRRLEKRRAALVMEVERVPGAAALDLAAEVPPEGGVLVVEAAGRDLEHVDLVARADTGEVRRRFTLPGDLRTFRFLVLPVPPGRFHGVAVIAAPRPGLSHIQRNTGLSVIRAGRLEVRSWALHGYAPAAGGGAP
jgi:hypothetical protein